MHDTVTCDRHRIRYGTVRYGMLWYGMVSRELVSKCTASFHMTEFVLCCGVFRGSVSLSGSGPACPWNILIIHRRSSRRAPSKASRLRMLKDMRPPPDWCPCRLASDPGMQPVGNMPPRRQDHESPVSSHDALPGSRRSCPGGLRSGHEGQPAGTRPRQVLLACCSLVVRAFGVRGLMASTTHGRTLRVHVRDQESLRKLKMVGPGLHG